MIILVGGQLIVEQVFTYTVPVSVFITFLAAFISCICCWRKEEGISYAYWELIKNTTERQVVDSVSFELPKEGLLPIGPNGASIDCNGIISRLIQRDKRPGGIWKQGYRKLEKQGIVQTAGGSRHRATISRWSWQWKEPWWLGPVSFIPEVVWRLGTWILLTGPFHIWNWRNLRNGLRMSCPVDSAREPYCQRWSLQSDTELYLLDEPTNNLDTLSCYHQYDENGFAVSADEPGKTVAGTVRDQLRSFLFWFHICAFADGKVAKFRNGRGRSLQRGNPLKGWPGWISKLWKLRESPHSRSWYWE